MLLLRHIDVHVHCITVDCHKCKMKDIFASCTESSRERVDYTFAKPVSLAIYTYTKQSLIAVSTYQNGTIMEKVFDFYCIAINAVYTQQRALTNTHPRPII